jgi:hypothetical protein
MDGNVLYPYVSIREGFPLHLAFTNGYLSLGSQCDLLDDSQPVEPFSTSTSVMAI